MKQEKVKVIIEKVGRIWVQAKDTRYNNKMVKIELNENFTKEYAKEHIGKELELDCKIEFKERYIGGYEVIMYPINLQKIAEEKKKLEYKELKNKILGSISKWTKEKAEEGILYVSKFVKENIEKLTEEDKKEVKDLIKSYERKIEEIFYHIEDFSSYEEIEFLKVGDIVQHRITGKYGVVIKASKSFKVSQADVEDGFHAWGTRYATETICRVLDEEDSRVQEFKEKKMKKNVVVEVKDETVEFLKEFKEEFSIKNEIEFSAEEKEILKNKDKIRISGKEIWIIEKNGGFGQVIVIEEKAIWHITNNTGDGDNWEINYLESQTAEGYGYKLEKTNKRLEMIEKYIKIKNPLIID